jgi:hypothetical protein
MPINPYIFLAAAGILFVVTYWIVRWLLEIVLGPEEKFE